MGWVARFPAGFSEPNRARQDDPERRRLPINRTPNPFPFPDLRPFSLPSANNARTPKPETGPRHLAAAAGGRGRGAAPPRPVFIHNSPPHRFGSTKGLPPQPQPGATTKCPDQIDPATDNSK